MTAPEFIRLTLVGRSIFDVEASLHDPKERQYLSNLDFLKSVAEQRDSELRKSRIIQAVVAFVSLYTLFVTVDGPIAVEFFGLKIKNVKLFSELLLVLISVGTFYSITYTLNVVLATLMIRAIFSASGTQHYRYFIADRSLSDLWASIVELKNTGYASSTVHRLLMLAAAAVMLIGAVALPIVSLFVVISLGAQFVAKNGWTSASGILSMLSILILSASVFYFFVTLLVPFKFKLTNTRVAPEPPLQNDQ